MYFGQGQDLKLTFGTVRKVQYCHNQAIKTAYMKQCCLCQKMKLYFQDKTSFFSVNQDLTLYEF